MYHTIIVGAGFAGLAAAHTLKANGQNNFILIEARDRVGGRTKPGQIAGLDIDLGGMWLGPTQDRLKAIAERYQVQTYPTYLDGKAIYRLEGKEYYGQREDVEGMFNLIEKFDYLALDKKLKKLALPLDCGAPWAHPDADSLDVTTVEQWLQHNVKSRRLHSLFRLLCLSLFCAESSQVSMLFFLHYLKSGDGLDTLVSSDEGGAQNLLFHGSVHQIARKMGEELGSKLQLDTPVTNIEWQENRVDVTTTTGKYQAENAIIAIPPTMLPQLNFSPALPQPKAVFHERLNMGCCIKFWVAYDTPFWREMGYNGSIFRDDCPATPVMDVSPASQEKGVLAGFFDADHAINHGDLSTMERRQIVLNMLQEHFGDAALSPVDYVDNDWTAERWSGGCYGAYAPPGVYSKYGEWLRKPIGPLHWAGTETSARWTGYIDGAIRSGERAAKEVIAPACAHAEA